VPKRLSFSYYPWITQSISGPDLKQAITDFVGLLNQELAAATGNELQIDDSPAVFEVPQQLEDMQSPPAGGVVGKIGLLNPIGYALAHKDVPDVKAIAVVRRKIGNTVSATYKAQFYAHRRSLVSKLEQLRGRSIAFGSPQSTSNFLVPAAMLLQKGILNPLTGFTRLTFAGGHDKAAIAVYEGDVDIGAGHDGVIIDLAGKPGYADANQVLQNIAWSDPIPSDPVAINAPDQVRNQVTQALLKVAKPNDAGSEGNAVVKRFWGTDQGFETIDPEAYNVLFASMTALGLKRDDLLRKA
jgi:phosphonate transport system substrate-binding protein